MADEKIGSLYVQLEARTKKLEKQLKTTENKSKKAGAKSGKAFSVGFAGALGILFAFKKAFDFAAQAKNAARDAQETGNKFNTVFSSMTKQANEMADSFAESFGLAGSTARELLGNTGDLLVGFGFTEQKAADLAREVNSLAIDLASFTNFSGGAKGASAALTKALLGERESVKSLGISILEADVKKQMAIDSANGLTFATERQAKAQATLTIATRQSGKAVGDYARTQNDLANVERKRVEQTKVLQEALGNGLLPLFIALNKSALGWLEILKEIAGVEKVITRDTVELRNAWTETFKGFSKNDLKKELIKTTIEWERMSKVADTISFHKLTTEIELLKNLLPEISPVELEKALANPQLLKSQIAELEIMAEAIDGILNPDISSGGTTETMLQKTEREANAAFIAMMKLRRERKEFHKETLAFSGITGLGAEQIQDEGFTRTPKQLDTVEETVTKPLIDAGEQFGSSMNGSLGTASSIVSVLQSGMFRAGQGFLDYLGQGINLVSQVLGIISAFTPAGIVSGIVSGASTATTAVSSGASATVNTLNNVNNSVQAVSANLSKQGQQQPIIINANVDAIKFEQEVNAPSRNTLTNQGVDLNEL